MAVHYRTNLTARQLRPRFEGSSSMVCRAIQKPGPLSALEPVSRPAEAADRSRIVARTPATIRDHKDESLGHSTGSPANVQAILDADSIQAPVPHGRSSNATWTS